MSDLKRAIRTVPGYDCMNVPCAHEKKGDHGVRCDEWIYSVTGKDSALTLSCITNQYPFTVPQSRRNTDKEAVDGHDLSLHVTFATEPSNRPFALTRECDLLGQCTIARTTCLGAGEFTQKYAVPQRDQPESFWLALEALYLEWDAEAQDKRKEAEAWTPCKHCDGLGRVRSEVKER